MTGGFVGALFDEFGPDAEVWRLLPGVVTQVSPLLVRVPPSPDGVPCSKFVHYSPAVNDRVMVLVSDTARYVVGKVG